MVIKKTILSFLFVCITVLVSAQDEDIFGISTKAKNPKSESAVGNIYRNVLEMFSLEISGGGAYHQFSQEFYSPNLDLYPNFQQYQNFDEPLDISEENPLEMKSNEWAFPQLDAGLRINLFNLLTIGGGYGQEWGKMSTMRGGNFEFPFEGGSYQVSKFYGTVGLVLFDAKRRQSFLRWKYRRYASSNYYMQSELTQRSRQQYPWRFILEGEFGQLKMKNFVDESVVGNTSMYEPKLAVADKPYMGIALRIERDFSEYTKMFIKGGAEFREFTYAASDFSEVQDLKQTLYGMQVGFAIRFPGTKRCKIAGCGVVMKHLHNGIEYRGSGIFNYQNRKVGQWY